VDPDVVDIFVTEIGGGDVFELFCLGEIVDDLVDLLAIERGDEDEGDVEFLGDAAGVGCEDAEAATAFNAVGFVVDFHRVIDVGAVGGDFLGEATAVDGVVEFGDVFDKLLVVVASVIVGPIKIVLLIIVSHA